MLFNSYGFIFAFVPVTLLVFFRLGAGKHLRAALAWLVAASLFFYGWWNPVYLALIAASMVFNYGIGVALSRAHARSASGTGTGTGSVGGGGAASGTGLGSGAGKAWLVLGVLANLGALGYFKYAGFLVDNANALLGTTWHLARIVLPLGISFFTFQQIAYLVDAHRGEAREYNFLQYCLFVVYYPQLIAGPIVHHREVLPQFADPETYRFHANDMAVGITIFVVGLLKKVVLADGVAEFSTPLFEAAAAGSVPTLFEAWGGVLAYTFQIYFDFSGYSDMAIGLGRMCGIRLPLNFNSPYKAPNIIEFWRRWHMTLSRFLRDYLYVPLGGNRRGKVRRYVNLMVTMLLGGLWHGAAWNFLVWGALHGLYLVLNYAWHAVRRAMGHDLTHSGVFGRGLGRVLTFVAVVVAWVFFRAADFPSALAVLRGMAGMNGALLPEAARPALGPLAPAFSALGVAFGPARLLQGAREFHWLVALLLVAWFAPSTQEWMAEHRPAIDFDPARVPAPAERLRRFVRWQPSAGWALVTAAAALVVVLHFARVSEFLYYQF